MNKALCTRLTSNTVYSDRWRNSNLHTHAHIRLFLGYQNLTIKHINILEILLSSQHKLTRFQAPKVTYFISVPVLPVTIDILCFKNKFLNTISKLYKQLNTLLIV